MRRQTAILAQSIFFSAAAILVLSTAALVLFIGGTGLEVFRYISPGEFFLGRSWDQSTQHFGVLPLLYGTLATTVLTLLISAPLGIAVAIFMVEIAPPPIRRVLRTTVELFASLPSVIYGLLGLTLVVPWLRTTLHTGLGKGMLAAAIVLVFMTQPTIVTIAEDTLRALPTSLREGALALGATRWHVIWRVLLPAARQGLLTAVILGMGRAVGETMAVQMVIGNITSRIPTSAVTGATTMPAAIVTQLPEATSPEHRAALIMVALLLLIISLVLIAGVRLATGGRTFREPRPRPMPAAQAARSTMATTSQGR